VAQRHCAPSASAFHLGDETTRTVSRVRHGRLGNAKCLAPAPETLTGNRTIWRRLGMTEKLRDRVYEVSGTDPVKIAIMGAELQVSGTNA